MAFEYDGKQWENQKVYYWNARLSGKTALLSGPFLSVAEAEASADFVSPAFLQDCSEARKATFGVMECKAPGSGPGAYNYLLPDNMRGGLAVGQLIQ